VSPTLVSVRCDEVLGRTGVVSMTPSGSRGSALELLVIAANTRSISASAAGVS